MSTTQTPPSLTQQFAAEYAHGAVPAMLRTIRNTKRLTLLILAGVMAISYPHQAMFLTTVHGVGWLGWIIPLVVDLALLTMVNIVQTIGMARPAKHAATLMIVFCGLLSAVINVAAPAALMARVIFGCIVGVAIGVKVVASKISPDFAAIEAKETEALTAAPRTRKLDPAIAAQRAAKARATRERNKANAQAAQLTPAQKAARTRKTNKDAAVQAELDLLLNGQLPTNAPVSPATI